MHRIPLSTEGGALARYLEEIRRQEPLTREEEQQLFARMQQGDEGARARLVQGHLRSVVSIAKQYAHLGLPLSDLICEGNLGLVQAVERFDPFLGFKFISYAVWWIRCAILKALADRARLIRIPYHRVYMLDRIFKTARRLEQEAGHRTSLAEVAGELGMSPETVKGTVLAGRWHTSLDGCLDEDEDGPSLMDVLESPMPSPEEQVADRCLHETIEETLRALDKRDAEILRLYYGLNEEEPMTLDEIAQAYGLTRERIRQIKEMALSQLRLPSRACRLREFWEN